MQAEKEPLTHGERASELSKIISAIRFNKL